MANMVSGVWRGGARPIAVAIHNKASPSDVEWDAYTAHVVEALATPDAAGVAFTDGGGPNAGQRERMRAALRDRTPHSAVVSGNILVRGVVTALRWFNPNTHAFAPDRLSDATAFAGITATEVDAFLDYVTKLSEALTPPSEILRRS